MLETTRSARLARFAMGLGAAAVLLSALLRTVVSLDPLPYWSADPFALWLPFTGIGPATLAMLDLIGCLGAALVLIFAPNTTLLTILVAIGALGVLSHTTFADAELGMPWITACLAAASIARLPRDHVMRSAALIAVLALSIMLALRAGVQVFVEHPDTVADYQRQRDAFLASQGWSPDSMMARNYERRLNQPEATGWFGLANVFGSVMAASAVACAIIALHTFRTATLRWASIIIACTALLAAAAVWLSGSKGAVAAALLAPALLVAAIRLGPRGRMLLAALPLLVLTTIIARGLVGERIPELSLLFRWFYLQGATQIFLDHPLIGVGPAGFKDAYMLAKPPLSPEEVQSPHSAFFDWLSMIGLFALAWIILVGLALRSIAQRLAQPPQPADTQPASSRSNLPAMLGFALVAATIAYSANVEAELMTVNMAIARALSLLFALPLAAALAPICLAQPRAISLAAASAALVLLAHMNIEVVATWQTSAPLVGVFIGLACRPPAPAPSPPSPRLPHQLTVAALCTALVLAGPSRFAIRASTLQAHLEAHGRTISSLMQAVQTLQATTPGDPAWDNARLTVAQLTNNSPATTPAELRRHIDAGLARLRADASSTSMAAAAQGPGRDHFPTLQAAARLNIQQAIADDDAQAADRAILFARAAVEAHPKSPAAWAWYSLVLQQLAERPDLDTTASIEQAAAALQHAASLDPFGLQYPLQLARLYQRTQNPALAAQWARTALERNPFLRLDPLRQLTDNDIAWLNQAIQAGSDAP